MQIQQLNKSDAEKVFLVVKNVDGGGSITTGLGACLVTTVASFDGISSARSLAAAWSGFVGVAVQDIAINSFGLVQSWGYINSILLSNTGTSVTITNGDLLGPSPVAGQFWSLVNNQAASTIYYRYAQASSTYAALSASQYTAGLVRAL